MIATIWQDLRFGMRFLHRSGGFTAVAVLTLALGIGANTAIFSVVKAVLLRPLPYDAPDQLVRIHEGNPLLGSGLHPASPATYLDWQEHNPVLARIAAYHSRSVSLTGGTRPERVVAAVITPSLLPLLGRAPILGRSFLDTDAISGGADVVVLSQGLWQRRYGGRPDILGDSLTVDGRDHTIVGVMPVDFRFPSGGVECWLPLALDLADTVSRGNHYLRVVGRLGPGVSLAQAEAGMDALALRLAVDTPALEGWDTVVQPLSDVVVGDAAPALWVMWGAVGFVMLIVCGNLANLMLTRSLARQREVAIRTSLGAGRMRIVRLFMTESLLLSLVGGGAGVLVATWVLPPLVALSGGTIPRAESIGIDGVVLTFTAGLSLATGIALGLLQAAQTTRGDLGTSLKEGGRTQVGTGSSRLRGLFVVTEMALALVLLAGAGLMLRTFWGLQQVAPGFQPDKLLTIRVQLPEARYAEPYQVSGFYDALLERLESLPAVASAGSVNVLPTMGTDYRGFRIVGAPPAAPGEVTSALYRPVSPGYLGTMQIPVLRGRGFTRFDAEDSPPIVLVNDAFVRRYFSDRDAIGERIDVGTPAEIVGVVGNAKHLGLDTEPSPAIYVPSAQDPSYRSLAIAVRTLRAPMSLAADVRSLVATLDREIPVYGLTTGDDLVGGSVAQWRFAMTLLGIFAAVAIMLAVIGIYGVVAYSTSLRSHEIGVRIALGAQSRDVLKLILGHGLKLVLVGLGIGLAGAFALTRLLQSLLFGVTATDPLTFAAAVTLLFGAAVLASVVPGRRALGIDPIRALHNE